MEASGAPRYPWRDHSAGGLAGRTPDRNPGAMENEEETGGANHFMEIYMDIYGHIWKYRDLYGNMSKHVDLDGHV